MKTLPSKLFPDCTFSQETDAGFYDRIPVGFKNEVSLYLGEETVKDDGAIEKAAIFFDRVSEWDVLCRKLFASTEKNEEDDEMILDYFTFYKEEVPEVFNVEELSDLSLTDMIGLLRLTAMAAHGNYANQHYTVDFTLGYDQLLVVHFDHEYHVDHMAWES